jgi:hypothetical protein
MAVNDHDSDPTDDVELLELEHEGWQALCAGQGAGAEHYAAIMTEDAVMVLADGSMRLRDEVIESLRDAPPWDTYSISDSAVVHVTEDVCALTYRATGHRDGDELSGAMTSVYVRSSDGWRLALHQQTVG